MVQVITKMYEVMVVEGDFIGCPNKLCHPAKMDHLHFGKFCPDLDETVLTAPLSHLSARQLS